MGNPLKAIGRAVAWPFKKGWRVIEHVIASQLIRSAWKRIPTNDRRQAMDFLAGSKEKITSILSAVTLLLTGFGIVPDIVPMLGKVSAAIAAGDWQAAFATFVSMVLVLTRLFRRMRDDRTEAARPSVVITEEQ